MTKMSVEVIEDIPVEEYLAKIEWEVRHKVLNRALRAAAKLVQAAAVPRISRGAATGSSKKKSKKQKARDAARKPLAESIDIKIKSYADGLRFVAMVGPKKDSTMKGSVAHAHLLELGHKAHYWSKTPATRDTFVRAKKWLAPAVDTTLTQQLEAVRGTLERAVRAAARRERKRLTLMGK